MTHVLLCSFGNGRSPPAVPTAFSEKASKHVMSVPGTVPSQPLDQDGKLLSHTYYILPSWRFQHFCEACKRGDGVKWQGALAQGQVAAVARSQITRPLGYREALARNLRRLQDHPLRLQAARSAHGEPRLSTGLSKPPSEVYPRTAQCTLVQSAL